MLRLRNKTIPASKENDATKENGGKKTRTTGLFTRRGALLDKDNNRQSLDAKIGKKAANVIEKKGGQTSIKEKKGVETSIKEKKGVETSIKENKNVQASINVNKCDQVSIKEKKSVETSIKEKKGDQEKKYDQAIIKENKDVQASIKGKKYDRVSINVKKYDQASIKENKDDQAIIEEKKDDQASIIEKKDDQESVKEERHGWPCLKKDKDKRKSTTSVVSVDDTPIQDKQAYSTSMIPDIDAADVDNPLQVSEYIAEIYSYLFCLEKRQPIRKDYLHGRTITPRMRSILTDWLVQVHIRFHLLPETLHLTVLLLDRFLQAVKTVNKNELQLVGITCMFVASKYEEMYAPEIGDFIYIADNTYTKEQLLGKEKQILITLEFKIGRPHSIQFLRRFSKAFDADPATHTLAKYMSESVLVDYTLAHVWPSKIAAASVWLAAHLRNTVNWDMKMIYYTGYKEEDLMDVAKKIAKFIYKTHTGKNAYQALKTKYSSAKHQCIAKLKHEQLRILESISST